MGRKTHDEILVLLISKYEKKYNHTSLFQAERELYWSYVSISLSSLALFVMEEEM